MATDPRPSRRPRNLTRPGERGCLIGPVLSGTRVRRSAETGNA
jgi:hypothetical protein